MPPISEPSGLISQLEDEVKRETGIFGTSPTGKVKVSVDDDLFGIGPAKVAPKTRGAEDDDDLFAPISSKPKKPTVNEDLFSTGSVSAQPPKAPVSSSVFDSPPEDIFQSAPTSSTRQAAVGADDIFASSKVDKGPKNLDDIFASPTRKEPKPKATSAAVEETDGVVSRGLTKARVGTWTRAN